jgi:membrane-bound lytic murein transglycosylase
MPIDIIKPFLELLEKRGKPAGANGATRVPLMKEASLAVAGANP